MALPIKVEGRGLIPRGYGLAPRKNVFFADKYLITLIINTPGIIPVFVNPLTGSTTVLTRTNYQGIIEKYEAGEETEEEVVEEDSNQTVLEAVVDNTQPPATPPSASPVTTTSVETHIEQTDSLKEDVKPEIEEEHKKEVAVEPEPEEKVVDKEEEFSMKPIIKEDTKVASEDTSQNARNNQNKRGNQRK